MTDRERFTERVDHYASSAGRMALSEPEAAQVFAQLALVYATALASVPPAVKAWRPPGVS
jgi:hypothetical protein